MGFASSRFLGMRIVGIAAAFDKWVLRVGKLDDFDVCSWWVLEDGAPRCLGWEGNSVGFETDRIPDLDKVENEKHSLAGCTVRWRVILAECGTEDFVSRCTVLDPVEGEKRGLMAYHAVLDLAED